MQNKALSNQFHEYVKHKILEDNKANGVEIIQSKVESPDLLEELKLKEDKEMEEEFKQIIEIKEN